MLDQFQLNFTNIIMKNVNEKFESLDLRINNINIPNSNLNTNNFNNNNNNGNSFSQSVSYNFSRSASNNNLVHDPVFKDVNQIKILNLMEKIAKFKNHINIFRIHLSKNTTPSTLFFNRFPKPMFYDDEHLINSYNDIILKAQTDLIKASIKSCEDKLKYYEDELLGYINSLNTNDRNIKELYKKLEDGKLESLSEFFSKKSDIAYLVRTLKITFKIPIDSKIRIIILVILILLVIHQHQIYRYHQTSIKILINLHQQIIKIILEIILKIQTNFIII